MNEQLIIHATKKMETLRSILDSSSLRLSYSEEDFCIGSKTISSAAHPMRCFCRYDFKELKSKPISYGKYGIAFSIDWALKKRISPVLYMNDHSLAAKGLATLLRARQNKLDKLPDYLRLPIMEIKCFTKNVRGYNSHLKKEDFDFAHENEWRYVPRKSDIGEKLISQNKTTYKNNKEKYNRKLLSHPFKFNKQDIEVIFVAKKIEVQPIANEFSIDPKIIKVSNWKT